MSVKVPPVSMPIMDMGEHRSHGRKGNPMTARALSLPGLIFAVSIGGCASPPRADKPPEHPLLVEGEQKYLAGDREGALACYRGYRQGFGPSPHCADAWYWEGVILLEKGDARAAAHAFEECARSPRTPFFATMAEAGIGDAAFVEDRFADAIAAYQRALDKRCPDARIDYVLYRLAVAHQRAGEWALGRSCYETLLRDYPRSPLALRAKERLSWPNQGYYLQIAALPDEARARSVSDFLLTRGIPAKVVKGGAPDAPWLVWIGGYTRYSEARGAMPEIARLCGREPVLLP
jgi:tetratricopeptide (TPR) repeat protein